MRGISESFDGDEYGMSDFLNEEECVRAFWCLRVGQSLLMVRRISELFGGEKYVKPFDGEECVRAFRWRGVCQGLFMVRRMQKLLVVKSMSEPFGVEEYAGAF